MSVAENGGGEKFSSLFGFLMVIIGFAVGVGSLWRFPYIAGSNGGAVFLFVYLILIIAIGIPLLSAEISMGFATQKTAVDAYKALAPGKKWYLASLIHIAAALFIVSYTVPIYAWILNYIFRTATGFFASMDTAAISSYFAEFTADYPTVFIFAAINWLLLMRVVSGGLQNGVEKISKFLLPMLAVIMIIIISVGVTIPGAGDGVRFLLKPDFSGFTFKSLLEALGMSFFALGIGMLGAMVFGGYIENRSENICRSSSIICLSIIFAGVAAGFMIFPMVFAFGLKPSAGPGLTFITLPNVFNKIAYGRFIGTLFYFGFYIAAFTSSIGVMESVVGTFRDIFGITRNRALVLSMILTVAIGVPSILSDKVFKTLDMITSDYLIVLGAFFISIFVGWVWGVEKFLDAINLRNRYVRIWLKFGVKYVNPVVIIIIFVSQFL
jgi:NSS family neurotransmitter:Na+ symporter